MNALNEQSAIMDNLASWNDRAELHTGGGYGDLSSLIADSGAVTGVARRDFEALKPHLPNGSLAGLKLLHLQCHIGTDTICWPRLGAAQTWGLDFSPAALGHAAAIARQAGVDVTFVEGDARYAGEALAEHRGTFDVIVTSAGTITWLPELSAWASSIKQLLTPGGIFMIRDDHPLLFALDCSGLEVIGDYKSGSRCTYEDDAGYTTTPDAPAQPGSLAHTTNHNWSHDFQEIIGALLAAGLSIEALREDEVAEWRSLPMLEFDPADESWRLPEGLPRIPLTFSIVARKPRYP